MRSYSHLSEDERDQIGVLRAAGRSMGAIARALGRAKTTISRELQRNALPSGGYSPLHDNDPAFAQHGLLRTMRDMTTWFCDAYASWQKGGLDSGAKRNALKKSGFERPFQARQSRLGMAS